MRSSPRALYRARFLAMAFERRGDQGRALHWSRAAMATADALNDLPSARARHRLNVEKLCSDLNESERLAEEAVELARGSSYITALALRSAGLCKVGRDDRAAVELLERASLAAKTAKLEGRIVDPPAGHLGMLYARLGDLPKAVLWCQMQVAICQGDGEARLGLPRAYKALAVLYQKSGESTLALEAAEQALAALGSSVPPVREPFQSQLISLISELRGMSDPDRVIRTGVDFRMESKAFRDSERASSSAARRPRPGGLPWWAVGAWALRRHRYEAVQNDIGRSRHDE